MLPRTIQVILDIVVRHVCVCARACILHDMVFIMCVGARKKGQKAIEWRRNWIGFQTGWQWTGANVSSFDVELALAIHTHQKKKKGKNNSRSNF